MVQKIPKTKNSIWMKSYLGEAYDKQYKPLQEDSMHIFATNMISHFERLNGRKMHLDEVQRFVKQFARILGSENGIRQQIAPAGQL